ncbi:MAG: hypothetical protein GXY13_07155 [Acidimicrobiales bacterium]|nr:hypothetical protein [Acidimicrobiales bacterium]
MELAPVALVVGLVAVGVAALIRRRVSSDAPTRPGWAVPDNVDRRDLEHADRPWMVAVFSSATCNACRATWEKARQLESDEVGVQDIDSVRDARLHERYGVDAVPLLLLLDERGDVRGHFLGEPTTADLWSAMAALRDDGDPRGDADPVEPG